MRKCTNLKELEFYVGLLQNLSKIKGVIYDEIIKECEKNFNIKVSVEELDRLYEPTEEEESEDLKLIYQNAVR